MIKKIFVLMCVTGLLLMSSRMSMSTYDKGELLIESLVEGNTLIAEYGNNQTIEVDTIGNIVWQKTDLFFAQDAERLSNNNTLIVEYGTQQVIEVNPSGNIVWQKTELNSPMDVERLSNGNTLIAEFGGGVIEVDNNGDIVWQKTGLLNSFDAERLPNGNTLIVEAHIYVGRVLEVDADGNEVWNISNLSGPVDAERLSNGNTLITEHVGKKVIEVDNNGNIVWQKTGLLVPKDAERLPNGNTLIVECGANRVIEVDNNGNIVWVKSNLWWPADAERLPNQAPNAPTINGPPNGKKGIEYEYTFNAVDRNGDDIYYYIEWGDGNIEEWIGPNNSGIDVKVKHTWKKIGTYTIKAKAKDVFGAEGPEATLKVRMPKNKAFNFNQYLLEQLLHRFPNTFPILRYILGFKP